MEPAAGFTIDEAPASKWAVNEQLDDGGEVNNRKAAASSSGELQIYCIYSANPRELLPNSTRWFKDGRQLTNVLQLGAGVELKARRHSPTNTNNNPVREHNPLAQDSPLVELPFAQHRLSESTTANGYPVLTIRQPGRQDAGNYDCQLANSVGLSERLAPSEACRLEVNFRPSVQVRIFSAPPLTESPSRNAHSANLSLGELAELDLEREIIRPDSSYVLVCDLVEAEPRKIRRFHWWRQKSAVAQAEPAPTIRGHTPPQHGDQDSQQLEQPPHQQQPFSTGDSSQLLVGPLGANFTPTAFACAATNALGRGEPSRSLRLQLSYLPGKLSLNENILHNDNGCQQDRSAHSRFMGTKQPPCFSLVVCG